jgi:hypothetical protein
VPGRDTELRRKYWSSVGLSGRRNQQCMHRARAVASAARIRGVQPSAARSGRRLWRAIRSNRACPPPALTAPSAA